MSWIQMMRPILSPELLRIKSGSNLELNDLEHAKDIVDLLRYTRTLQGIDGEGISK
jgi:hypothetical protein